MLHNCTTKFREKSPLNLYLSQGNTTFNNSSCFKSHCENENFSPLLVILKKAVTKERKITISLSVLLANLLHQGRNLSPCLKGCVLH